MRSWRDILSSATFDLVAGRAPERPRELDQCVQKISQKINQYHRIKKTSYSKLVARIAMLRDISRLAGDYNSDKYRAGHAPFDLAQASQRRAFGTGTWMDAVGNVTNVPRHHKNPVTNSFLRGVAKNESLDRNMLTLQRRALRKAGYLEMLRTMYRDEASRTPEALISELNKPQEVSARSVGIVNGVRMEKLDPVHRPVELARDRAGNFVDPDTTGNADPASMNTMLLQWMHESKTDRKLPPFFLWLEDKIVCLSEDKGEIARVASVEYAPANHHGSAQAKLRMVFFTGNRIMMSDLSRPQNAAQSCSTADYSSAIDKGGAGVAAYVWTLSGEVLIGQHQQSGFHHSSFESGGEVRCAGMIRIDNHRVQLVTNNSGHYRPSAVHLRSFISFLQDRNAIDGTAHVHCAGFVRYTGDVAGFMSPRGLPIGPRMQPRVGTHRMPPRVGTHRV